MIFECKLTLLVTLQGESSWKGGSGGQSDVHWKDDTSKWKEGRIDEIDNIRIQNLYVL